jgi:DNA-binding NarL/FixJ family response regulator
MYVLEFSDGSRKRKDSMTIKVLIADDHKLFRQGLKSLMRTRGDIVEVVGEAACGREVLQLAGQLKPDVILMDIYMPGGNGLHITKQIKKQFPNINIVMLTSSEDDEHLYEAVRIGASGYLVKSLDANELFDLLQGVMHGEAAMTSAMAKRLLRRIAKSKTDPDKGEETLTERELAVLRFVASGASNSEIGEELCISVNTVKTHLRNILQKLQLDNRTQAATYAVQHGLVSPQ